MNQKIPLKKLFVILIDKTERKRGSIYLKCADCFVKELWNEIVSNQQRKLSVRSLIREKLKVSISVFYAYKNGKKSIPIEVFL